MIHHIEMNVSNLAVSRRFYDQLFPLLGYTLFQDWPEGFSYRKGKEYLVFVQTPSEFLEAGYHRKAAGLNHLAFHAPSTFEVDAITEQMRQSNAKILYEDWHPYAGGEGTYAVFMEDPDRLKIEVAVSECGEYK
ncbi:VOC family protein [Planococcus sp. CAU13]|uniref:VOC family protein n=1 Tax=Planococcus sp. CAU13 TaxID=1541197 RepID=UPI0005300BAE|nr:VOC family protein [Planococcus sp. CAU13]